MFLLLLAVLGIILLYRWYRQSQIMDNLTDKYVFITGCDSGFGNLLAKKLDKRGMKVLAACMTQTGAENLKKETSSRLQVRILDVTDSTSVSSAAEWVSTKVGNSGMVNDANNFELMQDYSNFVSKFMHLENRPITSMDYKDNQGLWGLVNNAGIGSTIAPNEWHTREDFFSMMNVNFLGTVDVTVQLLYLVRKAQGRIVTVSSGAGRLASLGGGYAPSKFAVEAFSDSLRRDMREFGVKVSIIEPGAFQTQMICHQDPFLNKLKQQWEKLPAKIKEDYGEDFYKQCIRAREVLADGASPKITKVPDCMEHALTAVHPWTRYSPGWDCKLFYIPLSYAPTPISDYVLCGMAPKRVQRNASS